MPPPPMHELLGGHRHSNPKLSAEMGKIGALRYHAKLNTKRGYDRFFAALDSTWPNRWISQGAPDMTWENMG